MVLLALMWVAGCGGVFTGIPDLDSPDGRVFAQRCGGCHGTSYGGGHGVPDPRFRTMTEWQEVLPKMDRLIRERGLPPLTEPEREAIIRYLSHHAKL
jgi:mono/diheme cytochrome c family protein